MYMMSSAQKEALSPARTSGGAASPKAGDTADHFEKLSGIDKSFVLSVFSVGSPRLVEKGKKLAREGHLSESLAIHEADGTVVLRTKCWASQKKLQYNFFLSHWQFQNFLVRNTSSWTSPARVPLEKKNVCTLVHCSTMFVPKLRSGEP